MNLGSVDIPQWREPPPTPFTREERKSTTIWLTGLSRNHDVFISAAARGLGYIMRPLPLPDNSALKVGKEYGNRGQCNPTYYTAGALIAKLRALESGGATRESIVRDNVFLTAGSCGPCRFGMYTTEYRKALREAGFGGFRILQLRQEDIASGDLAASGLEINLQFVVAIVKGIIAADVLNLLGNRIRPYEVNAGQTDAAFNDCSDLIVAAFERRGSVLKALRKCRMLLREIPVDRVKPKPVVCVIGEIWAMSTEGDGNYGLHRFLEDEGAEVLTQPLFNWLLYLIWEQKRDIAIRRRLRGEDLARRGLSGKSPRRRMILATMIEGLIRQTIRSFAFAVGLSRPYIINVDQMAATAHKYYNSEIRGGEGFMEVGKYLNAAEHNLAHLVVSVKPFGCLPSSGVSDGIQSLVSARCPNTAFYAVETTGDGQVSVYSRIQMMLCNAKARAQEEFQLALNESKLDQDEACDRLARDRVRRSAMYYPPHSSATTAANMVTDLGMANAPVIERQY